MMGMGDGISTLSKVHLFCRRISHGLILVCSVASKKPVGLKIPQTTMGGSNDFFIICAQVIGKL